MRFLLLFLLAFPVLAQAPHQQALVQMSIEDFMLLESKMVDMQTQRDVAVRRAQMLGCV